MGLIGKKCPNCGSPEIDDKLLCKSCGSKLMFSSKGELKIAGFTKNCPNCGFSNSQETRFCGQCGQKLVVKCPICNDEHELGLKFCPVTGVNIGEYPTYIKFRNKIIKENELIESFKGQFREIEKEIERMEYVDSEEARSLRIEEFRGYINKDNKNFRKRIWEYLCELLFNATTLIMIILIVSIVVAIKMFSSGSRSSGCFIFVMVFLGLPLVYYIPAFLWALCLKTYYLFCVYSNFSRVNSNYREQINGLTKMVENCVKNPEISFHKDKLKKIELDLEHEINELENLKNEMIASAKRANVNLDEL
ncbi:MAG: zinc ribbon domain-containing protein [Candidatus Eremiobacteraeota bacterium]|nr:zinc ribbon domain-containing protein [Candidatus Eremiobacteraeota bacterium]